MENMMFQKSSKNGLFTARIVPVNILTAPTGGYFRFELFILYGDLKHNTLDHDKSGQPLWDVSDDPKGLRAQKFLANIINLYNKTYDAFFKEVDELRLNS